MIQDPEIVKIGSSSVLDTPEVQEYPMTHTKAVFDDTGATQDEINKKLWKALSEVLVTQNVLAISEDGYWVVDGQKTDFKAIGEKGEPGVDGKTPLLRVSADGMSLEISTDSGDTWLPFIVDFNKLRVLGYVDSIAMLPKNANIGDIYGVWNQEAQEGAGAYELYIQTVKDWLLDYTITKVYDYDTELPSSATDGTAVLVPVTNLTLDKEKVDGYKVYKYSLSNNGWIMVLNTAEIYAGKEDIINYGDNVYALVQSTTEGTYELYKRQIGWVYFGTNASITYHLVQNVNEGTATNVSSGKAVKDAIDAANANLDNFKQEVKNTYGDYTENPEFVKVVTDKENKVLYGVQTDGNFYFGAGCPPQVKDYIQEKLDAIIGTDDVTEKIDTINEMIAFFDQISHDENLKDLLDALDAKKVDKEEGKSLIDAEYADGVHYIENPEFAEVKVDNENRILEAIMKDGTKLLPAGVKVIGTAEYDGATIKTVENPEFASVWLDGEDNILFGVEKDGNFSFGCGVPKQVKEYIEQKIEELSLDEYESIVTFIGDYLNNTTLEELLSKKVDGEYVDNPEFIEAKVDAEGKLLEATEKDGTKVFGGNVKILGSIDVSGVSYKVVTNPEWLKVVLDSEDSIICGIKADGRFVVYIADFLDDIEAIKARLEELDVFSVIENPEFVYVQTDNEGKILFGLNTDGEPYFGVECPKQIKQYIEEKIAELSLDELIAGIQAQLATKVDKEEGKSLIDAEFASSQFTTDSSEHIQVTTDSEGKILAGRTPDGAAFEKVGFSSSKISIGGHTIENIEDPEGRSEIITDSEGRIISYRDSDGVKHENVGIKTGSATIDEVLINGGNATLDSATIDSLNLTSEGMTEFQQALKDAGFQPGGAGDWSDYISKKGKDPLHLPVPRLAYINLTNAEGNLVWPTSKTADLEAIMEFADMQGNYFKKNIIFNAQGNSSMNFIKKNGSIKMFDSSVYNSKGKKGKGDKFGVKFGDWVSQTTYHVKAFYTDYFKGVSYISYQLALEVANTYNEFENRTWKKGLFKDMDFTYRQFDNPQIDNQNIQIDNGALCQPDGFPCIIYLNGDFYGIYVWFIKKDAANFNMDANNPMHVYLDGRIDNGSIFNANGNASNIKWNPTKDLDIEVRHPEDLVTMDGKKYDSDVNANQELAGVQTPDATIPSYDDSETYSKSDIVAVNGRAYLSLSDDNTGNDPEEAKCSKHGDEFDKATNYWIDITFTNEVKKAILRLSKYKSNINNAGSIAERKLLFEEYFDLNNQIDYQLVQEATNDDDGFSKNWQWTTWDGVKWFVNNYDKDCAFGGNFEGTVTNNPQIDKQNWKGYNVNSFNMPFLVNNYSAELKVRWKELVDKNIFTKEHIISLFDTWVKRIGSVNYSKEYTKWSQAPCNRDSGINIEYWRVESWAYQGGESTYNSETNYSIGDTCKIKVSAYTFTFECIKACQGESPIIKTYTNYPDRLGYRDNLWRVCKYIEQNIDAINEFVENI